MRRKNAISLLLSVLMILSLLSACGNASSGSASAASGGSSSGERAIKDTMTIGLFEEPSSLDPMASALSGNADVNINLYDTLFYMNPTTGEVEPKLCTSYEQVDELTYNLTLRDDVIWHNGDKLTAEDVAYSLCRMTTAPGSAARFGSIDTDNTAALDELTVQLKLKQPFGKIIQYLTVPMSCIMNKNVCEAEGENAGRKPVGTGPYKFVDWVTGDSITCVRNDEYWGDVAVTENVVFKFFADANIRAIQLETGAIDFFYTVGATDYENLGANPDLVVVAEPSYTHENLYFDQITKGSPFLDVKVREAMVLALDIPAIVKTVWGPLAEPASGIYSSAIEGFVKTGPATRDVEKAKQLLTEAGYPDGLEGDLYYPNNSNTQAYLEIMQSQWLEAGLHIQIHGMDSATVKEMNRNGENPLGRSNFCASTGDPIHALAAWEIGYVGALNNVDEYIDSRIKACRASSDTEERAQLLKEIQEYAAEQFYAIPVAFIMNSYAMTANLFGFVFNPGEYIILNHMGVYAD